SSKTCRPKAARGRHEPPRPTRPAPSAMPNDPTVTTMRSRKRSSRGRAGPRVWGKHRPEGTVNPTSEVAGLPAIATSDAQGRSRVSLCRDDERVAERAHVHVHQHMAAKGTARCPPRRDAR